MAKEGKTDKKNYPKYDSYRLAFKMIDDALKCGCPLQAITIEESILTDRLSSTLNVGMPKQATYVGEIPILKITAKQSRWSTEMMSFLELGTLTFAV